MAGTRVTPTGHQHHGALVIAVHVAPARPHRRDTGLSLVEMMVSVTILSVLGGLLTNVALDLIRTSAGTTARLSNVDELRVAMDSLTKNLRTAVRPEQVSSGCPSSCTAAFVATSPAAVSFYANGGPGKVRLMTYQVVQNLPLHPGTGRLVEQVHVAAPPGGTVSTACAVGCTARTLATGLPWPVSAGAPVFTFAESGCADFAVVVDPADVACVAVDLPVSGARDNPGTSVSATVFLPNSAMGR